MSCHCVSVPVLGVGGVVTPHSVASLHEEKPEIFAMVVPCWAWRSSTSRTNFRCGRNTVLIHAKAPVVAPHVVLVLPHLRLCHVGVLIQYRPVCLLQVWVVRLVFRNVSLTRTIWPVREGVVGKNCVVCVDILQCFHIQSKRFGKIHTCNINHLANVRLRPWRIW